MDEASGATGRTPRTALRWLRRAVPPAVALSLSVALARSLGVALDGWGLVACAAGVHAAYRFDALADRVGMRRAFGEPGLLVVAADGVVLAAAALSSPRLVVPLLALSLAGLLYIPLKQRLPKNLLTAGAWTATVFALPLDGLAMDAHTGLAVLAVFLAVASNGNLCDLPDVERDRASGVKGFGPWLGARSTARIAGSLGAAAALTAVAAGVPALCAPAVLYAVIGWVFPDLLTTRRWLRTWIDAALILPGPIALLL